MPSYGSLYTHMHTKSHTSHFHVTFHALLKFNKAVSHDISSVAVRNCNPHVRHTARLHTCSPHVHVHTHARKSKAPVVSVSTRSVQTQTHAGFDPEKLLSPRTLSLSCGPLSHLTSQYLIVFYLFLSKIHVSYSKHLHDFILLNSFAILF